MDVSNANGEVTDYSRTNKQDCSIVPLVTKTTPQSLVQSTKRLLGVPHISRKHARISASQAHTIIVLLLERHLKIGPDRVRRNRS